MRDDELKHDECHEIDGFKTIFLSRDRLRKKTLLGVFGQTQTPKWCKVFVDLVILPEDMDWHSKSEG